MKVRVINKYRDKETMQIVSAGTIIPDMRKKRFDEIQLAGNFLEELPEPTLKELREQAKELGIPGCNKMKKEEKRNSIPEETAAEPLNDEALETVSGGRRLENSLDLNIKSDLQDPGRKK